MEAGLGLPDTEAWYMVETIADKSNIGYKQFVSFFLSFLYEEKGDYSFFVNGLVH